ncbi:hypothetical protein WMY93_001963 [Mugilogobius chulae]|uniref:Voltage-dependent T-type calcium channel subunit alpha n=1 Tax=Mugilogobius chulae TaxID=88201 RepID=A0AAW0Q353_9GOBI
MVILLNCVTLGMYQPCENIDCTSDRCQILQAFDAFIYIFFALEMVVKMVALGIFGQRCYLGDTWNRLDFFIVMAGMVEYSLDLQNINLSAIRTVRVLRPLKAINRVPSMRILVNLLLDTLPMLGNVLLLCFFVFFIFGIIGVQLWAGLLRNRCYPRRTSPCTLAKENKRQDMPVFTARSEWVRWRRGARLSAGGAHSRSGSPRGSFTRFDLNLCAGTLSPAGRCVGASRRSAHGRLHDSSRVMCPCVCAVCEEMGRHIRIQAEMCFDSAGLTLPAPYYRPEEDDERPFICSLASENGIMSCTDVPARREGGRTCCLDKEDALHRQALGLSPEPVVNGSAGEALGLCINWNQYYTRCHTGNTNPHKGAINFDNIVYAWIVIFQVITLEGWVEIMYYVMDAHSFYNFIYFILLIIIGSFFMINLCLVVIATQFSETKQREHQLMQEQRAQCLSSSTLASMTEPGDCYEEIFQLVCHILRKAKRRSAALYYSLRGQTPPAAAVRANRRTGGGGGGSVGRERHQARQHRVCRCPRPPKQTHDSQPLSNSVSVALPEDAEECPVCSLSLRERTNTEDGEDGEDEEAIKESDREERPEEQAQGKKRKNTCFGRCRGIWTDIRRKLWGIVESKYFSRGIMIAILINTISMGIEHHNQPEELTNVLEICNIVFTSMFTLEMILKLTAFGFFEYLRNPTTSSTASFVCEIIGQADGGLSVLRTFRLLRVIKLVRFMPALRRQLVVLMKTMDNVATFCMLLMLFIFIFSILGMHIFGCKFSLKTEAGDTVPDRKNFDSLLWAIVTVFQILTQEDWNMVLYNGMASTSPCAALYFVALMTFGNYVLFNLLVAILVEGFQAEGDANRSYSDDDRSSCNFEENDKLKDSLHLSDPKICTLTPNGHLDMSTLHPGLFPGDKWTYALSSRKNSVISLCNLDQRAVFPGRGYHNWGRPLPPHPQHLWARRSSWNSLGGVRPFSASSPSSSPAYTPNPTPTSTPKLIYSYGYGPPHVMGGSLRIRGPRASSSPHHHIQHGRQEEEEEEESLLSPPSLHHLSPPVLSGQFGPRRDRRALSLELPNLLQVPDQVLTTLPNPYVQRFRRMCQSIIAHKLFDYVVLAFIFSNCITVALERPKILQGSLERVFLTVSNYIFTAIFVGEMTLKVVSMGLYMGEQAYLRSSWNILDGFLVFVSLIDIVVSMAGGAKILGVLRVLRLLRTLRPLRVISRAPGLKLVVETLITSLKPIGNIVLICCAFFIIFGILGVQLFKGKFFYCFGPDTKNITNKSDCLEANYKWVHHKYNFDNLGQALMSLFVLASKDGWVNIMYHGLDAVAVDQQPITNNNPWMLLYFISFLLIVSFFVLNMFVGVVVENFHKCRQHQEVEEAKRREEKRQKRMEKKRRKAQRLPYFSSYGRVRLMIHTLCTNHYLDLIITFIICINVITMSLEHYDQPHSLDMALKYCNYFFTSMFVLEAVLKLIAFGFRRFFKDRWNQLDLAIVLLSVMGITLEEIDFSAALPINPTIIRIMRVLRIARVLKLLKMATGMRALLDTVVQALPQVGNLGLLFMLLFFIYAALGVELFGELVCNEDYPCEGMSRHATFENFGMAFLTLFQVSTGDNWNGIMKDTLRECPPDHGTELEYACNPSLQFISPMYFVSFVLTAQFVLINVVVAVLMKHLDDSNKEAQEEAEMDAEIELELAQGTLCCMGAPDESQWLDSVSLLMKDSLEGEMLMIDNLSGSVFHHYSSPPLCKRCKGHPQEQIKMAEIEQASLKSEQMSDKSSSPALPDELSLDGTTADPLISTHAQGGFSSSSPSSEEPEGAGSSILSSPGGVSSCSNKDRSGEGGASGFWPLLHLPTEFFRPTVPPGPSRSRSLRLSRGLRLTSPRSWASLRSPGARTKKLRTQYPSHSDSSLATGSSEGSLQTTLEEALSFSVSPPQVPECPVSSAALPLVCPVPQLRDSCVLSSPVQSLRPRPTPSSALTLQAIRGHQRSQSSGRGSTSPGYTREDSMDPSDEDLGIVLGPSSQAGNSEHLSEALSSLSLTSLLAPSTLLYPAGVKKCNSTGSLDPGALLSRSREEHRDILGPWTDSQTADREPGSEARAAVRAL